MPFPSTTLNAPNCRPLAEVGVNFTIKWDRILRNNFEGDLRVFTGMDSRIHITNIQPCINYKTLSEIPKYNRAIILIAYGMGGMPTNNECLMKFITEQINNKIRSQKGILAPKITDLRAARAQHAEV